MADKKKKNRRAYLNDFKKNEAGEYEYQGVLYAFADSEEARKRAYTKLWLLLALTAAAVIGSGCVSGAGILNTFYVIIPYIGEISCLFALTHYHFKLLTKGDEVREYVYTKTHPRMAPAAMLLAFFAIVGFAMSLLYSILSGFADGAVNTVVYLVLKAVSAALALIYRNAFSKLEWIKL